MLAKRKLTLTDTSGYASYNTNTGLFFVGRPILNQVDGYNLVHPYTCRDSFHSIMINVNYYKDGDFVGFVINKENAIKTLNDLFKKLETKLGLEKKTVFYRVQNNPKATLVKPAAFWMENQLRKTLFTLFIKAGAGSYTSEITDLRKSGYCQNDNVWEAMNFFLDGNIHPLQKTCTGFINMFYSIPKGTLKEYLSDKAPASVA